MSKTLWASVCVILVITCVFLLQSCQLEGTPVVSTGEVTAITGTTATCGGNIEDNGVAVTVRGVCYNTIGHPSIDDPHTTDGSGSGDFRSFLTGLQPNTTYYVRAYAGNSGGVTYGNEVSFTTTAAGGDPDNPVSITTKPVTNIFYKEADCGGIINTGFANVSGVCYNTTGSPTLNDSYTTDGSHSGEFTSHLDSLQPGTTYYVRAYASTNNGVVYGNEISFTTKTIPTSPTELLTIPQGWRLSAAESSPAYPMSNGLIVSNLFNGYLYDFELDDIIVFSTNGTHVLQPGTLIPSGMDIPYQVETNLGQWYFDNPANPTLLFMQIPFFWNQDGTGPDPAVEQCALIELSTDMLMISYTFNDDENPSKGTYTFTLTYVPAQ